MKFISHRGNLNGPIEEYENHPEYILEALKKGFNVEIDVRVKNDTFYLGHDFPKYKINKKFLINNKLWCHAKDLETINKLDKLKCHFFWHQEDDVTITSQGYFWTYPGKKLFKKSICVLPEKSTYKKFECYGICSDYILKYKKKIKR
jgi:hypothetical protein